MNTSDNFSINYIVCLFFGRRRSNKINRLIENDVFHLLKKHLNFLSHCDNNITQATFVVNGKFPDGLEKVVEECGPYKLKISFLERENVGFSYGSWNDTITHHIRNNNDSDYYFLIEDDYIPTKTNFYEPFVKRCNDTTAFVCCLASCGDRNKRHAMISNGLLQGKACRNVYDNYGNVFLIYDTSNSYGVAFQIQTDFYDQFTQMNYQLGDISDEYCLPFHDSVDDSIILLGNKTGQILLEPTS